MDKTEDGKKMIKSFVDLDFAYLDEMHEWFMVFWQAHEQGLGLHEFTEVVKMTIGPHLTDDEIEELFIKINANSKKTIFWNDFITCVSQVVQEHSSDLVIGNQPVFGPDMNFLQSRHKNPIVSMRFLPRLEMTSTKIDYSKGRYLMLGREGLISMWTLNFNLIGYHWIGAKGTGSRKQYTDMAVLYPSTLVAVISTELSIAFWDVGTKGIVYKCSITALSNCATCLDHWYDLQSRNLNLLLWGDTGGDVYCLRFDVNRRECLFSRADTNENLTRCPCNDLLRGRIADVKLFKMQAVHRGWVTRVNLVPEMNSFLSCSTSNRKPLCFGDCHPNKKQRRYYATSKGVLCFSYSRLLNVLVTGCIDCIVRVWNFFIKDRIVGQLKGHNRPVVGVAIRDVTQHIISVDKGHTVKVYHLWTQQCVQHFSGLSLTGTLGNQPALSILYNSARNDFMMATTIIARASSLAVDVNMAEFCSHDSPVVGVAYSSVFDKIVSVCRSGLAIVWDVHNGKACLQFNHISPRSHHESALYEPEYSKLEVTAFIMDSSERRILTGAADGTVNLWNFSTGVLIHIHVLPEPGVISGLALHKTMIYAAGWHKKVFLLDAEASTLSGDNVRELRRMHSEDILCLTLVHPGLLATASYDGDIAVVARDTGHLTCRFNAAESRFPLLVDRVAKTKPSPRAGKNLGRSYPETQKMAGSRTALLDAVRLSTASRSPTCQLSSEPCDSFDVYGARYIRRTESDVVSKFYENSVDTLMFLPTRNASEKYTATLITAGAEGWIRAWSLHHQGGLRGQFCATDKVGDTVLAMATDPGNEFLFTGDTQGYVKVWDLLPYCNQGAESIPKERVAEREEKFLKKFVYHRSPFLIDKAANENYSDHKRPPPLATNPEVTLKTPRLLNVFRAHAFPITCITFVPKYELIVTGDMGQTVRLWLLSGRYIGTCGDPWAGLIRPERNMITLRRLPRDLRRCLSARSFTVIRVGAKEARWAVASDLVKRQLRTLKSQPEQVSEDTKARSLKRGVVDTDMMPSWSDPTKSDILGMSYRPNLHFNPRRAYVVDMNKELGQFPAFRRVDIHDLETKTRIRTPPLIVEKRNRQAFLQDPWRKVHQRLTAQKALTSCRLSRADPLNSSMLPPVKPARARRSPSRGDTLCKPGASTRAHLVLPDGECQRPVLSVQSKGDKSLGQGLRSRQTHLPALSVTQASLTLD